MASLLVYSFLTVLVGCVCALMIVGTIAVATLIETATCM